MNNSYLVENGKVFVSNHDGIIEKREYNDNIKQILIEENILERLQDEIKAMEKYELYQEKTIKKFISSKMPCVTLFCLGTVGLVALIPSANPNTTMVLISKIVGCFSITSIGVFGDILRNKLYKNEIKNEERYNILKELEIKQKMKIQSLKNEKAKNSINNNINVESVTLNHKKEEEILKLMIQEYIDYNNNNIKEEQGPVKKLVPNKKI